MRDENHGNPTTTYDFDVATAFTSTEVSRAMCISKTYLLKLLRRGHLPGVKAHGRWYIPARDLLRVIQEGFGMPVFPTVKLPDGTVMPVEQWCEERINRRHSGRKDLQR